jgi:hypothetical protein
MGVSHWKLPRRLMDVALFEAEGQLETQDFGAVGRVNGIPGAPSLALHFSGGFAAAAVHRSGQLARQIEITADAFGVLAAESEDGFGVQQIDRVLQFVPALRRRVIEELKPHLERSQRRKLFGQRRSLNNARLLLQPLCRPFPDL